MSDAPKEAQRVISLEDIKFNEANKGMAIVACIPIVGLILFFIEKDDLFVRYHAAQFALTIVLSFLSFIPCLGQLLLLAILVAIVMGMVKTSKGERFDLPVISGIALKLMNSVQ